MEDYSTGGGLGGLGGFLNNAATNPFLLAGLQMLGNSTPQIGRIPNTMQGVPQLLFQSGTAARNRQDELNAQRQTEALFNSMIGGSGGNAAPAPYTDNTPQPDNTPAQAPDTGSGDNRFQDTFNAVKSSDPATIAGNFKALGTDYGGLTIADAAKKLAQTNKTSAAQLLNAAKKSGLPPDAQLNDQVMADPNFGPAAMKAFLGNQYKLSPEQWDEAHGTWNDVRQNQAAAQQQQAQQQQQPGPFDNAPTGTAQQAPGTVVVGPTPEQAAAAKRVQDIITNGGAPPQNAAPAPQQYQPSPNATMNQMPAGPTPQQQAISQQAQRIMSPAGAAQGRQPTPQAQGAAAQPARPAPAQNMSAMPQQVNPRLAAAVLANPHASPQVKAMLLDQMNPSYQYMQTPDGTILALSKRGGPAQVAYQGASKMQFGKIGSNLEGDVYGFIDAANHKTYDINGNPIGNGGAGVQSADINGKAGAGKTGQEFLDAAVPEQYQEIVKGIANYEIDPKNLSFRKDVRDKLQIAAKNYDHSYDQKLYVSAQKAFNDFMSGNKNTPAGNLTSGLTAIEHLGRMDENSQKLGGASRLGPLNMPANVANIAYKSLANNPDLARYNQDLDRFVEEGTAFYRGIGGSESDIKRGLASISAAQSPEARSAAISEQAHLMAGKLLALEQRVKNAMGPALWKKAMAENPEAALLTQRAHDILNRMNAHPSSKEISAADSQIGPPINEGWMKGTRPGYENYWFKPDPDRPGKFLQWQGKQ